MLRTAPTWLKALLIGQAVNAAGALAWIYLTLYLVDERGLPAGTAALITATYGVGLIAGNLGAGSLGDRLGLRPVLVASLATWAAACVAVPLTPTPLLAPVALLAGASGGAGRPLMSALVATAMPTERRREAIALSRVANNLGTVVGPPLGGLLATTNFDLIFVIDAVSSVLLIAAVVRWCPSPRPVRHPDGPRTVLHALRADRAMVTLLVTVLAVDTAYRLVYTVLPLFLRDRGAPPLAYGVLVSLNCVVIVLFEARLARRLADRSAAVVIGAGYALVGLGWLVLGAAPTVVIAFVAVLVVTAGEMLYKPTATARAADLAPSGMDGRYQSLYAGASITGAFLSPLLGTTLYGARPWLVWPLAGAVALLAATALVRSARGREKDPRDQAVPLTARRQHAGRTP
ncbi:Predicted arabinose efflux permease, MFS family [Micromonospora pattaloongensis]|uniref:Predicted arabinose efflux permease, MFS family n=1 Tax=Micromonospora pattaloongensis TaxID=405436 RepID=A0A1H3JJL1_9ACTN|nr:MFS transporter [Micromonospora pattaloongensis]SDY39759.1 Predicted arabinose efflux permease, MFS family [Micromonospora pattaloongensis]